MKYQENTKTQIKGTLEGKRVVLKSFRTKNCTNPTIMDANGQDFIEV